ncbi:MAG: hypothetical protein IJR99_03830 [Kiritimatiellae bacterium]|nr:hypothetical protein [Kiritimatiellia bacterium]
MEREERKAEGTAKATLFSTAVPRSRHGASGGLRAVWPTTDKDDETTR